MKKDKLVALSIGAAMMANPVMAHMRKIAYTPITKRFFSSKKGNEEAIAKAALKRKLKGLKAIRDQELSDFWQPCLRSRSISIVQH